MPSLEVEVETLEGACHGLAEFPPTKDSTYLVGDGFEPTEKSRRDVRE
jgi:hypothetical protein